MATITNNSTARSAAGLPARGDEEINVINVLNERVAAAGLGGTDQYDLRQASSKAEALLHFHAGASVLGTVYFNVHAGIGFYADAPAGTGAYANAGSMLDPEITPLSVTRSTHGKQALSLVSQGAGDGILKERDVQSNNYDNFVTENITGANTLQWNTLVAAFSNNIAAASCVQVPLGTGTAAIDMGFAHGVDLLFLASACWSRAPSDNDTEAGGRYTAQSASVGGQCFGIALNDGSATQKCQAYGEPNSSNPHDLSMLVRNDRGICALSNGTTTERYNGTITFDATSNRPSITPSASAGSDYIVAMGLKLKQANNLALVDTTIPTTGDYAITGAGFRPRFVLNPFMRGPTAYGTVSQAKGGSGLLIADHHETYSISSCTQGGTPSDSSAGTMVDNDLDILDLNAGVQSSYATGSGVRFTGDGCITPMTNSPAAEILGFALLMGN